jgi:signal peptidase I
MWIEYSQWVSDSAPRTQSVAPPTPPMPADTPPAPRSSPYAGWGFFLNIIIVLAAAWGLQALAVKPFRIPSKSMEPTLLVGDRILVDRVTPRFRAWKVGDVVVFRPPTGALQQGSPCGVTPTPGSACPQAVSTRANTYYIKRIVALAGDQISIHGGEVIRNGRPLAIPGARLDEDCIYCNFPQTITIPPGHVFMMGDNRGDSFDSRAWGPEPTQWIVGKARVKYWPLQRVGGL